MSPASVRRESDNLYVRNCPSCSMEITYTKYQCYWGGKKSNAKCRHCAKKFIKPTDIWKRLCPTCSKEVIYTLKYNMDDATRRNALCVSCNAKKMSAPRIKTKERNCPSCMEIITYKSRSSLTQTAKKKSICKHCRFELRKTTDFVSKPEIKVGEMLRELGINAEHQYDVPYKETWRLYDYYVPTLHLLIEVDGVYWHGKNKSYKELDSRQKKIRQNDIIKTQLAKDAGYKLVRIWEDEITLENLNILING